MIDLVELEDAARMLLQETGLSGQRYVDPLSVFMMLGYELLPSAPRGCRGTWGGDPPQVRVAVRGDALSQQEHSRHEGGHLLLVCGGAAFPHDEKRAVPFAGLVLAMPRAGVHETLRECGLDPRLWIERYPLVPPLDVLRRMAMVDAVKVTVRSRRGGRVMVANDNAIERESLEHLIRESALLDSVRVRDEALSDGQGIALPMLLDGRGCIVSVYPWP